MTYGWAILVVLIAISALTYFGVLNPSKFLPESCTLVPGITCIDHKATTSGIDFVVQNGMGQDLKNFTIDVDGCNPDTKRHLLDSQQVSISLDGCENGISGARLKKELEISFVSESGLSHTERGQFISRVEEGSEATEE